MRASPNFRVGLCQTGHVGHDTRHMNYRPTSSSSPGTRNSTRTTPSFSHIHIHAAHVRARGCTCTHTPLAALCSRGYKRTKRVSPPKTLEGKNGAGKAARSAIPRNRGNLNEISPVGRYFFARYGKAQRSRKVTRASRWMRGEVARPTVVLGVS